MGTPRTIVRGNMSMKLSTSGDLVKSLFPTKDFSSLVRVVAEITQNVMDWAYSVSRVPDLRISTSAGPVEVYYVIINMITYTGAEPQDMTLKDPLELSVIDEMDDRETFKQIR